MATINGVRDILHCDLNNFYASVECVNNPYLKDKSVVVCGNVDMRHGIVLAKSTKAKLCGIKTGDAVWQALIKCPDLIVVPPTFSAYSTYSKMVQSIYYRYTDIVESYGMDECWLDVTHSKILGDSTTIANQIRESVKKETGLTISVGVSFNKTFAKLGSDMKKPDAITVIPYENFPDIIYNLAVGDLFMVGRKTEIALNKLNIITIGDLAAAPTAVLKRKFGINGIKMQNLARGLDNSPVSAVNTHPECKSVGHGFTSSIDIDNYELADSLILRLTELVCSRIRSYDLKGKTLCLHIRYSDLSSKSHQIGLLSYANLCEIVYKEAYNLIRSMWNPQKDLPLRTITLSLSHLTQSKSEQYNFFNNNTDKCQKLEQTIDKIRDKYGYTSIVRAQNLYKILPHPEHVTVNYIPFQNGGIVIEEQL